MNDFKVTGQQYFAFQDNQRDIATFKKLQDEWKAKQPKTRKRVPLVNELISGGRTLMHRARKMVGPIFNGGLVRESLDDMLTFKEDTMFRPYFIGEFAFS